MISTDYRYSKLGNNIQIHTTGCPNCIYDAYKYASALPSDEHAIVFNTCAFLEDRSIQGRILIDLLSTAFPDHTIHVLGCDVNHSPESYKSCDKVVFNEDIAQLAITGDVRSDINTLDPQVQIKIQDGCKNRCSYCIINKLRSNPYSIPYNRIVSDIKSQINGRSNINVMLYGTELTRYFDEETQYNLADVLEHLVEDIPEIGVFELSTLDPASRVTEQAIEVIAKHKDKFLSVIYLGVQSGSDSVLKDMRRGHNTERITYIHEFARERGIEVGWDIIVGFPTETEEHFQETYDLVSKLKPIDSAIYVYSPRVGTDAAEMPQLSDSIKRERYWKLYELNRSLTAQSFEIGDYQMHKTRPLKIAKRRLLELMNEDAPEVYINLADVEEIAVVLHKLNNNTIIHAVYSLEDEGKCQVVLDFLRKFIENAVIICHVPQGFYEDVEKFEETYTCIVRRINV